MPSRNMIIAVDGPAASGKGTIAKALAQHFNIPHMDTGLLYRAVALNLWRFGGDPDSEFAAVRACDLSQMDLTDPELKSEAIGGLASRISTYPLVRSALVERQRAFAAQEGGAVLDGRDIGTVIAPGADVKLFVTAKVEVRAERRCEELLRLGKDAHLKDVLIDLQSRDERDRERQSSPLRIADGAAVLDTSDMNKDEAIAAAVRIVEAALA